MFRLIEFADENLHRLGLRFGWVCDLYDIGYGMRLGDLHLDGQPLRSTWIHRLAIWWYEHGIVVKAGSK